MKCVKWPHVTTCFEGCVTLSITHHLAKFNGHRSCDSRDYDVFNLSHDLARPCDQRFLWLMEGSSSLHIPTLSIVLARGIVVVGIWWFYLVTWSHKTTRLYVVVTLWVEATQGGHNLPKFVAIDIVVVEIKWF